MGIQVFRFGLVIFFFVNCQYTNFSFFKVIVVLVLLICVMFWLLV